MVLFSPDLATPTPSLPKGLRPKKLFSTGDQDFPPLVDDPKGGTDEKERKWVDLKSCPSDHLAGCFTAAATASVYAAHSIPLSLLDFFFSPFATLLPQPEGSLYSKVTWEKISEAVSVGGLVILVVASLIVTFVAAWKFANTKVAENDGGTLEAQGSKRRHYLSSPSWSESRNVRRRLFVGEGDFYPQTGTHFPMSQTRGEARVQTVKAGKMMVTPGVDS